MGNAYAYTFEHRELIIKLKEVYHERLDNMTSKDLYNYYVETYENFDYKRDSFHEDLRMVVDLKRQYERTIMELSYDDLIEEWNK